MKIELWEYQSSSRSGLFNGTYVPSFDISYLTIFNNLIYVDIKNIFRTLSYFCKYFMKRDINVWLGTPFPSSDVGKICRVNYEQVINI